MNKWTQEQAIAYESACEIITQMIGMKMHQIYEEEAKANPNPQVLEVLRHDVSCLSDERTNLIVIDDENVSRVCAKYAPIHREFMAQLKVKITVND